MKLASLVAIALVSVSLMGASLPPTSPAPESEPTVAPIPAELSDAAAIPEPLAPTDEEAGVELSEDGSGRPPRTLPGGPLTPMGVKIALNPYGCVGNTEWVHKSNNFASLHTTISRCNNGPNYLITGSEIMRINWALPPSRVAFDSAEARLKNYVNAGTKRYCKYGWDQTYFGNGYHRIEIRGKNYIARTRGAESRFGCTV